MSIAIATYLITVNLVAFVVYGVDKRRARKAAWRVSEATLLVLAFAGGAVGALVGMLVFHHKTRKWRFRIAVPIALALTLGVGGSALYLSDYYHATDTALQALSSNEQASVEVRTLPGGELAFVPDEPMAGMIFYPGAKVQPESYAPLMRACADQGVLCVLLKPPANLAILNVNAADGIAAQFPDVDCWLIAGHSMGGVAAAQYLEGHPGDFDGIVFLASYPAADLSLYQGRALSITGTNDGVLNRDRYETARAMMPASTIEMAIEGGNHAGFGNYGEQAGDGQATIAPADQQAQAADAIANFAAA